jgi:hypothetical protein
METLKKLFKVLAWFIVIIFLMTLAFSSAAYFMSGNDKEVFINILQRIPVDRFWIFPLVLLCLSLYLIAFALKKMYAAGYGEDKVVDHKKVEEIKKLVMQGYLNKK